METPSFRIVGFDAERPPVVQPLYFQLNESAPPDWCQCFDRVAGKQRYPFRINGEEGEIVESWVKTAKEVPDALETAKRLVSLGNEAYEALLVERRQVVVAASPEVVLSPEQVALNEIVAGLSFDDE